MRLRSKLVIIPMIASFLVFLLIIILSLLNFNRIATNTLTENQSLLLSNTVHFVDEYIIKYKDMVTFLSQSEEVTDTSDFDLIDYELVANLRRQASRYIGRPGSQ